MRSTFLFAAVLLLAPSGARSDSSPVTILMTPETTRTDRSLKGAAQSQAIALQTEPTTVQSEKTEIQRRCAFIGRCGSFILIGSGGTAAYILGTERYIADLVFDSEDPNWWIYRPTPGSGDPGTTGWAFARVPFCGKYRVLRFANGVWSDFDLTDAWGGGLGSPTRTVTRTVTVRVQPNNQELLNAIRDVERKVDQIRPVPNGPSLLDLQNQIKKP
jgi:hypothetical protein